MPEKDVRLQGMTDTDWMLFEKGASVVQAHLWDPKSRIVAICGLPAVGKGTVIKNLCTGWPEDFVNVKPGETKGPEPWPDLYLHDLKTVAKLVPENSRKIMLAKMGTLLTFVVRWAVEHPRLRIVDTFPLEPTPLPVSCLFEEGIWLNGFFYYLSEEIGRVVAAVEDNSTKEISPLLDSEVIGGLYFQDDYELPPAVLRGVAAAIFPSFDYIEKLRDEVVKPGIIILLDRRAQFSDLHRLLEPGRIDRERYDVCYTRAIWLALARLFPKAISLIRCDGGDIFGRSSPGQIADMVWQLLVDKRLITCELED